MYDCSGQESVFIVILECKNLSVCQRVDASKLPAIWYELWDCNKVIM